MKIGNHGTREMTEDKAVARTSGECLCEMVGYAPSPVLKGRKIRVEDWMARRSYPFYSPVIAVDHTCPKHGIEALMRKGGER